jgi:D-alanyl-D-alanine carboxypeptidase (penicillin-binding protein 5/6)
MKDNVVFRYSHRVENKKHVRKRSLRMPFQVLLLASVVFGVGWFTLYHEPSQTDQDNQSILGSAVQTVEPATAQNTATYELTNMPFPSEGQGAIGTLQDGALLASTNEEAQPMASITKLITALAILEKAPLLPGENGDTIMLTAQDEQYYWDYVAIGGTVTDVSAGLEISQYDVLQAMLLPSSNNMADTIVDYYFSSREEYLDFTNKLLQEYGLTKTTVADASGFSPNNISTPSELISIGQKALQNPVIAEIVAKPKSSIAIAGEIPNYNALIEEEGITGIKPGFTDEAGRCLLFSSDITDASGDAVTVIGVIMGVDSYEVYVNSALSMLDEAKKQILSQKGA